MTDFFDGSSNTVSLTGYDYAVSTMAKAPADWQVVASNFSISTG